MVKITEDEFGITKLPSSTGPEIVKRFTFTNTNGVIVQVRIKRFIKKEMRQRFFFISLGSMSLIHVESTL